jgi:MFS family permease
MQTYGINRGTAGWFASVAPLTIGLLAMPIGLIGTRISLKKAFAVGAFLTAGGLLTPLCSNYPMLMLTRVSFAMGTAITFSFATTIAAEWFTSRELPMVNGITMSVNNVGNAVAFVATVPLAAAFTWQMPVMIYGTVALTGAVAWAIFGRDRQSRQVRPSTSKTPRAEPVAELTLKQILSQRSTILLAMATMGCWCLGNAMGSWLPSYYHEVFKMPLEKASSITAIITVAGTFSSIMGGLLPLRIGRRKPFLIIPGVFMGLSALGAVFFNNQAAIYLAVACFGIFANLHSASLFTIPMELHPTSRRTGTIVIFIMLLVGNIGNFIGPLVVGYLSDLTGSYLPGFIISAVISLGLLAAGLMLPETGPRARKY